MKKHKFRYGGLLVFVLLAALCLTTANYFNVAKAGILDDKFEELERIQREIEQYQKEIDSKRRSETSVLKELEKLEMELALSEKELEYILARIDYLNGRISETKREIEDMELKIAEQKELFSERLVSMYKAGQMSYLEVLLSSNSLSDFMARLYYLREIAQDDVRLIEEYQAMKVALDEKKESLEKDLEDMTWSKKQEEEKRAAVASRSNDRERYLAQLQQDREKLEEALDQMERESKALEKVIADLQAEGHQREKPGGLSMIRPVSGGWVSSEYGNRWHPILGKYKWHSGIDIAVNSGTPIKAAEDGTVILSGSNGGYGLCVIIDHGGGISTLYGHASKLLVKKGDIVTRGQTVALAGSTGVSTGPHLHFEVRIKGVTDNPRNWVKF
ncbi:MAG TPA: peptidoglycan DD-metalloendopeptidase family protein [Bacillota bacterium]|nr:peptidoglycan DD-metalloendopeptidase family protein [Candidatus Fermentithermobacillaceae bacterium]HOB30270.1 peptidoglycan DD-metalloendopeptidase family protein [Bacillota bacterium]HOK64121.1 peptidoglycan DD-metalloendopeptidase family protein [Bacillota bacterium]HOQ02758.1 peptidoglycan DD-metalloendopeptidase family protein [Bacillota bacterium]HPV13065.1 peptidoglycan DD-metalloendopeptidase family protein [Bacillota bacterium]